MSQKRDFNEMRWVNLRRRIFRRDGHCCRWCKKKAVRGRYSKQNGTILNCHHIKTWEAAPMLRYEESNLITLCKECHDKVWGKEQEFEVFFKSLIASKKDSMDNLLWMLDKSYESEDG